MATPAQSKDQKDKKSKGRRLHAPSETVRERSQAVRVVKPSKASRARSFFSRLGSLKLWKPFKAVGRFISRFLIPPYFKNSLVELRMVTWPDRKQTRQLTFAVIVFSIIFGALVAIVDFGLDKLFKKVILHI